MIRQTEPKQKFLKIEARLPETDELTKKLEAAELDLMGYDNVWQRYRIRITRADMAKQKTVLTELLKDAYDAR